MSSSFLDHLVPMSDEEFRRRVSSVGRISVLTIEITNWTLFGVAIFCFLARLCIRWTTRHRFYTDDYLLLAAVAFLCGAAVTLHMNGFLFSLLNSMFQAPELNGTTAFVHYIPMIVAHEKPRNVYSVLSMSAIYFVKFAYFAFFKSLVRHFRRLTIYYWCCVAFTVVSWIATISEGFVMNMYQPTAESFLHGLNSDWYTTTYAFTISLAGADILTDLLIISIPFILLRSSSLKLSTKLGIGSFLSLSAFMIGCSMIRAAAIMPSHNKIPETTWRFLWQQIEASIGVMMGSITAFRTVLVNKQRTENNRPQSSKTRLSPRQWFSRLKSSRTKKSSSLDHDVQQNGGIQLPTIPSATFTGFRTFVRRNNRTGPDTTLVASELDFTETDYHAVIRGGPDRKAKQGWTALDP